MLSDRLSLAWLTWRFRDLRWPSPMLRRRLRLRSCAETDGRLVIASVWSLNEADTVQFFLPGRSSISSPWSSYWWAFRLGWLRGAMGEDGGWHPGRVDQPVRRGRCPQTLKTVDHVTLLRLASLGVRPVASISRHRPVVRRPADHRIHVTAPGVSPDVCSGSSCSSPASWIRRWSSSTPTAVPRRRRSRPGWSWIAGSGWWPRPWSAWPLRLDILDGPFRGGWERVGRRSAMDHLARCPGSIDQQLAIGGKNLLTSKRAGGAAGEPAVRGQEARDGAGPRCPPVAVAGRCRRGSW